MIVLNSDMQLIEDTPEAKFGASIVITISDECDLHLEIWDASTKHPDVCFSFADFEMTCFMSFESNIVAWLAQCASRLSFAYNMYTILSMATEVNGKLIADYYMSTPRWLKYNQPC